MATTTKLRAPDGKEFESRDEWRKYVYENFYTVKHRAGAHVVKAPGDIDGQPFDLAFLKDCTVALLDRSAHVQADDLQDCRVFIGPCESTVFLRNCADCTFTVACNQLRMRDCRNCTVRLYSQTDPVIETSTRISFGPYNGAYPGQDAHFEQAKLNPADNHWRDVFDFNADDAAVPQPHWERVDGSAWQLPDGSPSPAALTVLEAAFDRFDEDADGAWNVHEFNAYQIATGAADEVLPDTAAFREVFGSAGVALDGEGRLQFAGLVRLYAQLGGDEIKNAAAFLGLGA